MKENITVACAQILPEFGNTMGNIDKISRITHEAEADLIVFPELATSGYEFKDREEAQNLAINLIDGPEIYKLGNIARDTETYIVLGVPEKSGSQLYNSAALIDPEGEVSIYRKLQLFDREKNLFDPGNIPLKTVDTEIGRIGLMVCFDWIFPEIARILALDGMQILCHPSNLVLQYCQHAMFARSVENSVYSITCNRIGAEERTDRELTFTGYSQILSPRGNLLAQASGDKKEIIKTEITPSAADMKMITEHNHLLKDRRTDFYGGIV